MELAHTIFVYALAIFISWIWIDYYRLIDIYDKKKLKHILFTFALGFGCTYFVDVFSFLLFDEHGFDRHGNWLEVALFSFVQVGLTEEFVKVIPLLVTVHLFPKAFNEPVDFLGFATFSALGFAAAENIRYIENYNEGVVLSRSIFSVLSHTFDTALVGYGFALARYRYHKHYIGLPLLFFVFAVLSHGFYDYWLFYKPEYGFVITILFFLFCISIYSTMLTNTINNSKYFSYKKVINSPKIIKRLFAYFGVLFLVDGISFAVEEGYWFLAILRVFYDFYMPGIFIAIVVVRLSRFTLIADRWNPIRLELPFMLYVYGGFRIVIKGQGYNETIINKYYHEEVFISPLSSKSSFLRYARYGYIHKKIFLKFDETYYLTKFYKDEKRDEYVHFILKPKTFGKTKTKSGYPIAGLFIFDGRHDLNDQNLTPRDFEFKEWIYLKSLDKAI